MTANVQSLKEERAMFIADLQHFVDVWDSNVAVPAPARRVANQLGAIAEAATAIGLPTDRTRITPIHCSKRPGKVRCPGAIAILVTDDGRIEWMCTTCRDAGILSGYQGTPWDLTPPRMARLGTDPLTIRMPDAIYQTLLELNWSDGDFRRLLRSAEWVPSGVELTAPGALVESFAEELAGHVNHEKRRDRKRLLDAALEIVEAAALELDYLHMVRKPT